MMHETYLNSLQRPRKAIEIRNITNLQGTNTLESYMIMNIKSYNASNNSHDLPCYILLNIFNYLST